VVCINLPITSLLDLFYARERESVCVRESVCACVRVTSRERAERESEKRVSLLDLLDERESEPERDNSDGGAERQSELRQRKRKRQIV